MDVLAQLIGEGHLVADGGGKAVASHQDVLLLLGAAAERRHRQVEEGGDGAQQLTEGDKLANRYQMPFVVAIALRVLITLFTRLVDLAHADDAVVEAALAHVQILDAGQKTGVVLAHGAIQVGQELLHLVFQRGDR